MRSPQFKENVDNYHALQFIAVAAGEDGRS